MVTQGVSELNCGTRLKRTMGFRTTSVGIPSSALNMHTASGFLTGGGGGIFMYLDITFGIRFNGDFIILRASLHDAGLYIMPA